MNTVLCDTLGLADLSGMFRRSASLAIPHRKSFAAMRSVSISTFPVLPFLDFSVLPRKNLKFTKEFFSLPNPQNPWKRQRKYQNNQGNSLPKINQGNPKNQGKEGQGCAHESQSFGVTDRSVKSPSFRHFQDEFLNYHSGKHKRDLVRRFGFLTFPRPFALHDSNPYRIAAGSHDTMPLSWRSRLKLSRSILKFSSENENVKRDFRC